MVSAASRLGGASPCQDCCFYTGLLIRKNQHLSTTGERTSFDTPSAQPVCTAFAGLAVCSCVDNCWASQVTYGYGGLASRTSSPQSYGGCYSSASPVTPSRTPTSQLFGMRPAPAAYSPAPVATSRPSASSSASLPYYGPPPVAYVPSAPPSTLFGGLRVSPPVLGSSPYASPAAYSPNAYGAAPYSPASSPRASPYHGLPATGRKACVLCKACMLCSAHHIQYNSTVLRLTVAWYSTLSPKMTIVLYTAVLQK